MSPAEEERIMTDKMEKKATLRLSDGTEFHGISFGYEKPVAGEIVFNTAMTGYPESLTDPSYKGQIMVMTYPLAGNYGVPSDATGADGISNFLESDRIHVSGMVVCDYSAENSHWLSRESLGDWLKREKVPAITGIDTRELTKILREKGVMMGKILIDGMEEVADAEYDGVNFVDMVSCKEDITYKPENPSGKKVVLVDCGVKDNILRCLLRRGVEVVRVPWNHDFRDMDFDGLFLGNGPGNPDTCWKTAEHLRLFMESEESKGGRIRPIMGICMGNQMLGKAAGATIVKLKYGHRSHNQPVRIVGSNRCFITTQNHGYAVDASTLGEGWSEYFVNMNDGTNEGIRHASHPWFSVQFHPEACAGPLDTEFLFDEFVKTL